RAMASTVAESRPPETRTTALDAGFNTEFHQACAATGRRTHDTSALGETLLGLFGGRAVRILGDEALQRLARSGEIAGLGLAARLVEQCVGRFGVVRPGLHDLVLGGDGRLVIAQRVIGVADPVLRRGRQLALRILVLESLQGL